MNQHADVALLSLLAVMVGLMSLRVDVALLDGLETRMQMASTLATLAFVQSVMGGNSMVEHPERVKKLAKNKVIRFTLLFLTAFSVVRDLEVALLVSLTYMVIMQLLRTPEERKKYPYMI